MSDPTPSPVPEPGKATPSAVPPEGRSRWKLVAPVAVIGLGILAAYQLWPRPKEAAQAPLVSAIPTAEVTAGSLEQVIRLSGVTSSISYYNIRGPRLRGGERSALVLLTLMESGLMVKKGEVIATIDGQRMKDHIDDVDSNVQAAISDIKKRRAEQSIDWEKLQQSLKVADADLGSWKLEAGASEIRTVIDQEIIKLAVEEAEAALKQQQADQQFTQDSHAADVSILEITRDRHVRHRDRHVRDLERYTIRSPIDGMAVRQQIYRSGEMAMVEQGDQIYSGRLFMKVMDTSKMQVEAKINQAESSIFRIGQTATIGLDAFPDVEFKGKVHSIGVLAKGGRIQNHYVREIPVRIIIEGADERLIPDLSAYADVVINREDSTIQVPRAAVFEEQRQTVVFVKNGGSYQERPVQLGFGNYTHVAVVSGLQTGEQVALERPAT